ncbi:MAG: glutamine--fructose-6-phosphate transaminase (isomerizing) [Candidatus Omnitrophica bacterium]|nr:glutamine--fructose-6-phosphate transaminase (isomerizing) [Candidatus Omnitrophota bacterium]
MCGIVGYIGNSSVGPILFESLSRLEYRGYDSAGIALLNGHGIEVHKRVGKLKGLIEGTSQLPLRGHLGLGHTRWATHGEPSETNAHPHLDCQGRLAIVHNGIIENYRELKERLLDQGHRFQSQTDTEVIAHLVEHYSRSLSLRDAFRKALQELQGSYALCLLATDDPERLYGARLGSPLILGIGKNEMFLASDVPAVLGRTREIMYLNDREVVELSQNSLQISTLDGNPIDRQPSRIDWDIACAQKSGFKHFMLKEIHEQPNTIEQTILNRLDWQIQQVRFDERTNHFLERLSPDEQFVIIACGTAYHAALVGEYMLEEFAEMAVDVDLASEFRYRKPRLNRHTTVLAISQSGETADTLAGIRLAKEQGAKVLSICNVVGSSVARESDAVLFTHAGPEIAVASTKAYTAQLTVLALLTMYLANARQLLKDPEKLQFFRTFRKLPELARLALNAEADIQKIAFFYADSENFYYLGRKYNFPSALEGALKLKEICPKIHAEGYAAGEMKHGPIALIRPGWPVLFIATDSNVYDKVISNIEETRARKASCVVIASEGNRSIRSYADHVIEVPKTEEIFSPILTAIPLQLLAYYIADLNGCDVDQPPNLAKSVTVE